MKEQNQKCGYTCVKSPISREWRDADKGCAIRLQVMYGISVSEEEEKWGIWYGGYGTVIRAVQYGPSRPKNRIVSVSYRIVWQYGQTVDGTWMHEIATLHSIHCMEQGLGRYCLTWVWFNVIVYMDDAVIALKSVWSAILFNIWPHWPPSGPPSEIRIGQKDRIVSV